MADHPGSETHRGGTIGGTGHRRTGPAMGRVWILRAVKAGGAVGCVGLLTALMVPPTVPRAAAPSPLAALAGGTPDPALAMPVGGDSVRWAPMAAPSEPVPYPEQMAYVEPAAAVAPEDDGWRDEAVAEPAVAAPVEQAPIVDIPPPAPSVVTMEAVVPSRLPDGASMVGN